MLQSKKFVREFVVWQTMEASMIYEKSREIF